MERHRSSTSSDPATSWPDEHTPAAALVDRLIATGVTRSAERVRMITGGMQHVVVVVDDRLVGRFARSAASAESLQREAELLMLMDRSVSAPLPVPVHVEPTFTVHEMLHGEITSRSTLAALPTGRRGRLTADVATLLTEMSAIPSTGFPPSSASTSKERLLALRERAAQVVVPLLWEHQRRWFDELFDAIDSASFDHRPALIHGDLAPYHLLHDPLTGELAGVLDFGIAGAGDPATDLACLVSTWGETHCDDLVRARPELISLIDRARLVATALPLEWATIALEQNAPDMAVAHLGHAAFDIGHIGHIGQQRPPVADR